MGISSAFFREILQVAKWHRSDKRSLMLGRQRLNMWKERPKHPTFEGKPKFRAAAKSVGYEIDVDAIQQDDKYSESFFEAIGFGPIESLDVDTYQDASIIHDLNKAVPPELHEEFSFIIDGGTIEHVFNIPMAWRNVYNMLSVGGVFIAYNPMNGFPGHGMFQICPEAVYTFWKRGAGCEVVSCSAMTSRYPRTIRFKIEDPNASGERFELPTWSRFLELGILFVVKKTEARELTLDVLQSDYVQKWERSQRD